MEVVKIILTILEVISSVALILVVLFQSGKEAGLSSAIAGGNQDTYLSKNKGGNLDKMLASATKWIALAWILLTLSLSMI
ncbi:MAG: preprotein translocase subunit SecG [Ruminococcaceae bacterium]|nr:preprotein translocase subunit SecG [Oscillospiraceae bacterium]